MANAWRTRARTRWRTMADKMAARWAGSATCTRGGGGGALCAYGALCTHVKPALCNRWKPSAVDSGGSLASLSGRDEGNRHRSLSDRIVGAAAPWRAEGEPWRAEGEPWRAEGEPWRAEGEPWRAEGEPWRAEGEAGGEIDGERESSVTGERREAGGEGGGEPGAWIGEGDLRPHGCAKAAVAIGGAEMPRRSRAHLSDGRPNCAMAFGRMS